MILRSGQLYTPSAAGGNNCLSVFRDLRKSEVYSEMSSRLLDIQPHRELEFLFELRKQSSSTVHLINKTDEHVAFKVKTTSPKKYCVRPNAGVVLPNATCEIIVTMQAQKIAPPSMICKDKFLFQSTVVPSGTTEEEVTSNMFTKEDGRYVEERKLRVTLVTPPSSPQLSPMNGKLKASIYENSVDESQLPTSFEGLAPNDVVNEHVEEIVAEKNKVWETRGQSQFENPKDVTLEPTKDVQSNIVKEIESKPTKVVETVLEDTEEAKTIKDMLARQLTEDLEMTAMKNVETKPGKDSEFRNMKTREELRLIKDVEEMKSKLHELESKFSKAEKTIMELTEEKRSTIQGREILQRQLTLLEAKKIERKVQVGFPFLFVLMVGLVNIVFGYSLPR